MRIRIPNDTTWSEALPLECGNEESNRHNCIVQVTMAVYFDIFMFMSLLLNQSWRSQVALKANTPVNQVMTGFRP